MCERMDVEEVVEITGLCKETLFKLMDTGKADLGVVVPGKLKNTYVFFRPKVERFVKGGCDISEYKELVASIEMMNILLTNAIALLPDGKEKLREMAGMFA